MFRTPLFGLLTLMLPWLLFMRLAHEVWEGEGLPGDHRFLELLHAHRSSAQDAVAAWLSQVGGPVGVSGLAGIAALGLWMAHRRRALHFLSGGWRGCPPELGRQVLIDSATPSLMGGVAPGAVV